MNITRHMKLLATLLLIVTCGVAGQARAQESAPGRAGLRARMDEFVRGLLKDGPMDTTRRFFPTTGDWSYTHTVHEVGGGTRIQRWIFPAAQTWLLFGFDKPTTVDPIRESIQVDPHGTAAGVLIQVIGSDSRSWRLVGGNRFVPPGARASSPVFVEWRRERGQWVISAFGDERFCTRRPPGDEPGAVTRVRHLPDPEHPVYATNQPWYVAGELLRFKGWFYPKYGLPREIQSSDLEPFGWKGDVRVYVEKGAADDAIVLYIPTAPDSYQPYQLLGRGRDPFCPE